MSARKVIFVSVILLGINLLLAAPLPLLGSAIVGAAELEYSPKEGAERGLAEPADTRTDGKPRYSVRRTAQRTRRTSTRKLPT